MRKLLSTIADAPSRLLAGMTASVAALTSAQANAQGAGQIAENIESNLQSIGNLVVGGAFLVGIGLVGAGLMKLKTASDNPNQAKYSDGLWRIGVGSGLVALPSLTGVGADTIFGSGGGDGGPSRETLNF